MAYNQRKRDEAFSNYQVFINHRGPDTKMTLASLLYEHLHRLGLRVFLDREELNTGDCFLPQVKAAIASSSVQIVIFSPRYAESQWCLQELCWMLQQGADTTTIIPIFWDVEPSDLRRVELGQYAEAFKKHKNRGRMDIERWQEALKNAAELKGHVFHTAEGDWGKFVFEIVDIVQKKVRREPLVVAEHLLGLYEAGNNLCNEILKQEDLLSPYRHSFGQKYFKGFGRFVNFLDRENLSPYRECMIGMDRLFRDMVQKLGGEEKSLYISFSENQITSSDYEISDRLLGLITHIGIQEFGQLMPQWNILYERIYKLNILFKKVYRRSQDLLEYKRRWFQ